MFEGRGSIRVLFKCGCNLTIDVTIRSEEGSEPKLSIRQYEACEKHEHMRIDSAACDKLKERFSQWFTTSTLSTREEIACGLALDEALADATDIVRELCELAGVTSLKYDNTEQPYWFNVSEEDFNRLLRYIQKHSVLEQVGVIDHDPLWIEREFSLQQPPLEITVGEYVRDTIGRTDPFYIGVAIGECGIARIVAQDVKALHEGGEGNGYT